MSILGNFTGPQDHSHVCPTCHVVYICVLTGCRVGSDKGPFRLECAKCCPWEDQWPYPFA